MSIPLSLDAATFPLSGSRLIEAAAGTGKTWTIAALYVRLVLGHGNDAAFARELDPPEILVVTFTEAVAQLARGRLYVSWVGRSTVFGASRVFPLVQCYLRPSRGKK